jgi:hypothetical protein
MVRRILSGAAFAVILGSVVVVAQVPGRNVNVISGTTLPDGDPFLQRQNEPSVAVSTRNPQHLLGGANDYRTVDLPGLPDDLVTGDSWVGLYKSTDGGQTWRTNLIPGFPQDQSDAGRASPLKAYGAASDPTVRAGANGLFFYAGIAFVRGGNGAVFVTSFLDNNNKENGDPFSYLGTSLVASDNQMKFLDKPWIAVDAPRGGALCAINGKTVAAGSVYVAFTEFNGNQTPGHEDAMHGHVLVARSTDCGRTWSSPVKVTTGSQIYQGATLAIDPGTGAVWVAFRQFSDGTAANPDAIFVARSVDQGKHWSTPVRVSTIVPFDQNTTGTSFRSNAYPTMTIDETGRAYLAWAARGYALLRPDPATGDARVVLSTSTDATNWSTPRAIDNSSTVAGHQVMPAIAYGAGKLQMVYYDLRADKSGVFGPFIDDYQLPIRHTIDVRTAQAAPGANPVFTVYTVTPQQPSKQVSEYLRGSRPGSSVIEQLKVNPPNLPLFQQGRAPFLGDYIDVAAAPAFVATANGGWVFNTAATGTATFHTAWTDNRDVRPPADGNWAHYTPPILAGANSANACIPGQEGMRNQNIYTSRITPPLLAGSPGNTKPLSPTLQRGFVVFTQNATDITRSYRLTIQNQPPGGRASFEQFPRPPYTLSSPPPRLTVDVTVPARSLAARTVYITSSDPHARVDVGVVEITAPNGPPVPGGGTASVALNPDISNPDISNPDISNPDISNPDISNAEVVNPDISNPDISNPDISNPDISNPDISNPDISNVNVVNPDISNPDISNPDISNPDISNPDISNPDISNPDISNGSITDYTYHLTNNGNTTAAYSTNLLLTSSGVPTGIKLQLVVYKTYKTPVAVDCLIKTIVQNQTIVNVNDPQLLTPATLGDTDPNNNPAATTFFLAPGDSVSITLRVIDPDRSDNITFNPIEQLFPAVQSQEVGTPDANHGVTTPPIVLPPVASDLSFAVQPTETTSGQAIAPSVEVKAADPTGAVLPGVNVTLSLNPPGPGILGGAPTVMTNALGVAVFRNLRVDRAGAYALIASANGVPPVSSAALSVTGKQTTSCTNAFFGNAPIAALAADKLAIGDFDGDGLADVAIASGTLIQVFRQAPAGVWSPASVITVSGAITNLAAVDMNGDGRLDLVATIEPPDNLTIYFGDGAFGFPTATTTPYVGTARALAVGDFNNDGRLDIALATSAPDTVGVLLGNSTGTVWTSAGFTAQFGPQSIAAGDFNGDGKLDVAVANSSSGSIDILLGNGAGVLTPTTTIAMPGGASRVAVGDFNEDGILDLAELSTQDSSIHILQGDGSGHFATVATASGPASSAHLLTGDFNGDGHLDLAVLGGATLRVLSGDGSGNLAVSTTTLFSSSILSATTGDITGDGRADIVTSDGGGTTRLLTNACGSVPTITPNVSGTAGGGGWYRSDVAVSWTVQDPISGIASSTGCGPTTLTAETYGDTLTCSATNGAGGTAQASVTIKIDKTAPGVTGGPFFVPPPNAAGWNNTPVTVSFTGADTGAVHSDGVSCTSITLSSNTPPGGSVVPGICTDLAGNSSAPVNATVRIDLDAPSIVFGTGNPPGPGPHGSDVIIPFTVSDPISGVKAVTPFPLYASTFNGHSIVRVDGGTGDKVTVYGGGLGFDPKWLAISPTNGLLYITDVPSGRILRMSQNGTGAEVVYDKTTAPAGSQFNPEGLFFTPNGDLYFNSSNDPASYGAWMIAGGAAGGTPTRLSTLATSFTVPNARGIVVTTSGDILSVDRSANQIVKVTPPSTTPTTFIASAALPTCTTTIQTSPTETQPFCLFDLAVSTAGEIYVGHSDARQVLKFSAAGTLIAPFVTFTAPDSPVGFEFDYTGNLWVVTTQSLNASNGKLWRVDPLGTPTLVSSFDFSTNVAMPPVGGPNYYGSVGLTASGSVNVTATDVADNSANASSAAVTIDKSNPPAGSFIVSSTGDAGAGTLRQAILNANQHAGVDTITFAIATPGPYSIAPVTSLPVVLDPSVIDATTQTGFVAPGPPIVELKGTQTGGGSSPGLTISAGNSTVRGLVINRFKAAGIRLDTNGNNLIAGNFIGTDLAGGGTVAGNVAGIVVVSPNNTIGGSSAADGNVVSGNTGNGLQLTAVPNAAGTAALTTAAGTVVKGNVIGTNAAGMAALANTASGVLVSADSVTIGGSAPGEGNLISGNTNGGISGTNFLAGPGGTVISSATNLVVKGNRIGTNINGTGAVANGTGISTVVAGAQIGGSVAGERNIISGNTGAGITATNAFGPVGPNPPLVSTASGTLIQGNYIGVDDNAGTIVKRQNGFGVSMGSAGNSVRGNTIAGNTGIGISVFQGGGTTAPVPSGQIIAANYIGTTATGATGLGNNGGISIPAGSGHTIGGSAGDRNYVAGNTGTGIGVSAPNAFTMTGLTIDSNWVGLKPDGTQLANTGFGVFLNATGSGSIDTPSITRNVVSGNSSSGLGITHSPNAVITGNYLGTDPAGTTAIPNSGSGLQIDTSAGATIGGNTPALRNIASGNTGNGISIFSAGTIAGNYIGVDASGASALGNGVSGIFVNTVTGVQIGGSSAGQGNVISGNANLGISMSNAISTVIKGNYIGTNAAGTAAVPNVGGGIGVAGSLTAIGGTSAGEGNVISGNGQSGIAIGAAAVATTVVGNYIGTNAAGNGPIGNAVTGIFVNRTATIGGTLVGARNVISGNPIGIQVAGDAGTTIQGNYIGVDAAGAFSVPNVNAGVSLTGGNNTHIGGTNPGEGNVISGNPSGNVVLNVGASNNFIQGNIIGLNPAGTTAISGTQQFGINIAGATGTTIGGTLGSAASNVISGNQKGIQLISGATATIKGNLIGTTGDGLNPIGNGAGIVIENAIGSTIGGATSSDGNIISGNTGAAITLLSGTAESTDGHTISQNAIGLGLTGGSIGNGDGIVIRANAAAGPADATHNNITFNTITGSAANGVTVAGFGANSDLISSNSIYANAGIGIDLSPTLTADGVTPNDGFDADTGGNNLQNYPVISSAIASGGGTVDGEFFGAIGATITVELFMSDSGSPAREGKVLIATAGFVADSGGHAFIHFDTIPLTAGKYVTVTATGSGNNTSEFSTPVVINP